MALLLCFFLALALIWLVLTPLRFDLLRRGRKHQSQAVKGFCTLVAAGFAAWGCVRADWGDPYAVWIFAALALCALADIVLDYTFVAGGVLFFFGHVLYVAAFSLRATPAWWSYALFVLIYIALFCCFIRYRAKIPRKLLPGVLMYGAALSGLLGMAVTVAVCKPSPSAVLGAVGACLFLTSDVTLGYTILDPRGNRWHKLCLRQYYAGQMLLALSAHATVLL